MAFLLLVAPTVDAAASGARTALEVSCTPATSNCSVNDVAIAPSTSAQCSTATTPVPSGATCRFAAGSVDPQIGVTGTKDSATWTMWNLDGSTRQARHADPDGCPGNPSAPNQLDDCDTDVTDIAMSATGTRIAVASRIAMGGPSLLQVFDDTGTRRSAYQIADVAINDIAMDPAGDRVAVVGTLRVQDPEDPADTQDGYVGLFSAVSGGATPVFEIRSVNGIQAPATTVDLTGSLLVIGAGNEHIRFANAAPTAYRSTAITGNVLSVDAAATHGGAWNVAGYSSGFFGVFSSSKGQAQPSIPEYQKREAGEASAANTVAIRDDGTMFAVGHEGGHVRLYSLDPGSAPDAAVALLADKASLGGVDEMQFSSDGRYLAVLSDAGTATATVRFYYTGNNALDEMWSDVRANAIDALAVDGRGEHVVVGVGESVVVYDGIHRITTTLGTATQQAGTDHSYDVVFRNDGNRAEALTIVSQPPAGGVTAKTTPSEVTLLPGGSQTVVVDVDIPATWPSGTLRIPLRASVNGGTDGTPITNLDINVPITHKVTFEADGPESVGANGGGPAIFDITATNDGNVVEDVELSVAGLANGWTASIEPAALSLDPGESADVKVSLQPPAGAANGARIDVQLTHDGVAPQPLALTATVGAVFQVKLTAPVGTIVNPGVTAVVNLTVRNDGNTRDGAVVKINALPSGWLGGFINGQSELDVQDLEPCSTDPGSCSRVVQMTLRAPEDHSSTVPVQVTLVANSVGDEGQSSTARLLVTVQAASETESSPTDDDKDGNGIPAPGPFLLMALVALAAVVARRKA